MTTKAKLLDRWFQKAAVVIFSLFMLFMFFVFFTAYIKDKPSRSFSIENEAA